MDRLRDDTLAEIGRKKRAYSNEIASMVEELQMLREIYNGKRSQNDYYQDRYTIQLPIIDLVEDKWTSPSKAVDIAVGKTCVTAWISGLPSRRYVLHRYK